MRAATASWIAVLAALAAPGAHGQTKTGTTIAQFLAIEPAARTAALGNAAVALGEGIESVYFNPAAVGRLEAKTILFTHAFWFADIRYDYVAGALPVRHWGTFFGSVTSLNSGDIDVRTVERPLGTGEKYDVGSVAIGLGFGRHVTSRFSTGLQLNYVRERIWNSTLSTLTFNVGTAYELSEGGARMGACLSNMGTQSEFTGRDLAIQFDADPEIYGDNSALPAEQFTDSFQVPILLRVGLAWPYRTGERSRALFIVDALHPNDNTECMNVGAEWTWNEVLALRAGWQTLFQEDSELGGTVGMGLRGAFSQNTWRVDYAWADHDHLEGTHRMTLVLEI